MPLFDSYLMVDWSASSSPKTGENSIWWSYVDRDHGPETPRNPSTRHEALRQLIERLNSAVRAGRRVLVGFDFPFGYPRGASERMCGRPGWQALRGFLAGALVDHSDNQNNRFEAAARINASFAADGPFWGHPHQHSYEGLSPTRPPVSPGMPPVRRHVEERLPGAKSVWQLSGAGSVGGQALVGIPLLDALLRSSEILVRPVVWPFETGLTAPADRRIVLAEIYPSLIRIPREAGLPYDRTQVATLARWFADWDDRGDFAQAFVLPAIVDPVTREDIANEEGFILGEGCDRPPLRPESSVVGSDYLRDPGEITRRSFDIIAAEVDLAALPPDIRPIAARIVHACGMTDAVDDLAFSASAGALGRAAIAAGAPLICDVRMVAAGLTGSRAPEKNPVWIALDSPGAEALAKSSGQTRTAAGLELLADKFEGAVVVIGNAPTALFRLLELIAAGAPRPDLVLGFPVGFVGAAESKTALAANTLGLPFITLHGRRGGSAIAAAALNALILDAIAP